MFFYYYIPTVKYLLTHIMSIIQKFFCDLSVLFCTYEKLKANRFFFLNCKQWRVMWLGNCFGWCTIDVLGTCIQFESDDKFIT